MDRDRGVLGAHQSGLPRTRGDGPYECEPEFDRMQASPHTRGWTRCQGSESCEPAGFPAHAGMDPSRLRLASPLRRLPRTRGDGPHVLLPPCDVFQASPHTRGWTRSPDRGRYPGRGFPAHAGMDLARRTTPTCYAWLPRTRGDGPSAQPTSDIPYTASPHTRGWTRGGVHAQGLGFGFPAHAGMDPSLLWTNTDSYGLPRTRGDGPVLRFQA